MSVNSNNNKPECRVLQVFNSLAMGGAETWLIALLKYLRKCGDELPVKVHVDVCLTGGARALFDDEAEALGARLFYPHFTRKKCLAFTQRFRRLLAEGRYHAIHDHQDYAAGLRFMMGLGCLPPVRVAHVHNTPFYIDGYNSSIARRLTFQASKRFIARRATHITSTSQQMLTEFGFDDPSFKHLRRCVVHCGFDTLIFRGDNRETHRELSEEFGWDNEVKIILFVGRLDDPIGDNLERKNPSFALEVARGCIEIDPMVRMIMVGPGERKRKELESRVRGWGLGDKICLPGVRRDVARLMLGSNLFIFPSVIEGLGMVGVEAQAAGLPVLASDGVPRESMVIPELMVFKSLKDGVSSWIKEVFRMLNSDRPTPAVCNTAVKNSPFSIENSTEHLLRIYSGEDRGVS